MKRWLLLSLVTGCGSGSIGDAPDARVQDDPPVQIATDAATDDVAPAVDSAKVEDTAPSHPGARNPGGAPSARFYVVTAGQSNAGFRIDDGGISYGGKWNWPLATQQSAIMKQTLGALDVGDLGDRWNDDTMTAVGGCPLMKSTDGGCHFVDDLSSTDPAKWTLSGVGVTLAHRISKSDHPDDVVFVSWIQGEADAHALGDIGSMAGAKTYGFSTAEQWADHYKDVLSALLRLLRDETKLPKLRMVVQVIANYSGRTDLIRQAQLDAASESKGDIIIGNGNPWQSYQPNGDDWSHYAGQAYMDLSLETGRVVAFALAQQGLADTKDGPSYGAFPAITKVTAMGESVQLEVSNPNGAKTLILPSEKKAQGFKIMVDGERVDVTNVTLAAPFTLRLDVSRTIAKTAKVVVTYGTEDERPAAGQAITDDAATACPPEPEGVIRRNMPLMVKPT